MKRNYRTERSTRGPHWVANRHRNSQRQATKSQHSGDATQIEILCKLHECKEDEVQISKLIKMMSMDRKSLNKILYQMQKQKLITRTDSNPPKWYLLPNGKDRYRSYGGPIAAQITETVSSLNPTPSNSLQIYNTSVKSTFGNDDTKSYSSDKSTSDNVLLPPSFFTLSGDTSNDQFVPKPEPQVAYYPAEYGHTQPYPTTSFPPTVPDDLGPVKNEIENSLCRETANSLLLSSGIQELSGKNPVSMLNEYAQANKLNLMYKVSDEGPPHQKTFFTSVVLGTETYQPVEGISKKDSKLQAAQVVLKLLLPAEAIQCVTPEQQVECSFKPTFFSSSKNAVSTINEYAQANKMLINFDCNIHGPDHKRRFTSILTLGGRVVAKVDGSTKKESKLKAAEAALHLLDKEGKLKHVAAPGTPGASFNAQSFTYHDRVASMVKEKFEELLSKLPDTIVGRKIIAGFVMSQTTDEGWGEERRWTVISVSSGNRCVAGDKLSLKGETVNDCHAEVISRRGLMRYLYSQLLHYPAGQDSEENIFEPGQNNKLRLKPGIRFHLYISTAPCGDSALFAKSDIEHYEEGAENVHKPLFDNKKQGVLRTKVENGEGCIPIDEDANVPTWDGLLRGERLRTMSCSDKLAKWNYLGLQGALLSRLIEPIYMSSLTLGMLFHHGHLTRAICCRLDKYLQDMGGLNTSPFNAQHPSVSKISGDDPGRDTGKVKTREFSLNWTTGDVGAEVLDGTKGRCEARYGCSDPISHVCKSNLFKCYKQVTKSNDLETYALAKKASVEYQQAKNAMKLAFAQAGCGKWMNKPVEEDDFS